MNIFQYSPNVIYPKTAKTMSVMIMDSLWISSAVIGCRKIIARSFRSHGSDMSQGIELGKQFTRK